MPLLERALQKYRRLRRQRPLADRLCFRSDLSVASRALLPRQLFDEFYNKTGQSREAWEGGRAERSYTSMLEHFGAAHLLQDKYQLQWRELGKPHSKAYMHTREATLEAVLADRLNVFDTDETTLLMDCARQVTCRKRTSSRGSRAFVPALLQGFPEGIDGATACRAPAYSGVLVPGAGRHPACQPRRQSHELPI